MRCRRWLRTHRLKLLGACVLVPLAGFAISNLFLISPKGRAYVAERIARRTYFETSVEGTTWSPWNGITLYGLRIEQPEVLRDSFSKPLLSAQSIRIHPEWRALLRKRLVLRGVDIVKPDLLVPIELLSQIPHVEEEPALAANTPGPAAADPAAVPGVQPGALPSPSATAAGANPPVAEGAAAVKASVPEVQTPNVWIDIRDGRLGIVSVMSPAPLFEASGMDGSVPISGKPAKSEISFSRLKGLGQQAPGKIGLPLNWAAPVLEAGLIDGEIFGLDFKLGGFVALVRGVPFRINAAIPAQDDREIRIGDKSANLGKVVSQAFLQGYLMAPASWQGQGIAKTASVDVEIEGRKNRFDHGQALLMFRNGALRCIDARLCSDGTTIIGNGMLLSDGRMAANTRIVAAPETLVHISRFTRPDPDDADITNLTPLSTPQRAALDLQIYGRPGKFLYKPHPKADPLLLQ